jgi:hypothetical protein
MNGGFQRYPHQVPIYAPGKEPLPPGFTEEDRAVLQQTKKWEGYMTMAMESCALKTAMAGGAGAFDLGCPLWTTTHNCDSQDSASGLSSP